MNRKTAGVPTILIVLLFIAAPIRSQSKRISAFGYTNCILLTNGTTNVILDPNVGGRVLSYEHLGKNILFENQSLNGKTWKDGFPTFEVSGGRFDIGPEKTTPFRPSFHNTWTAEITGKNSARMSSPRDSILGIQLIRDFHLDENSSKLTCTQTIKNISDTVKRYAHWSRTFAKGGGLCLVPLNPNSRLPQGYAIYRSKNVLDFDPEAEENIRVRDGILEIIGPPSHPKFAIDSHAGWLAYISKDNQLFIKKFKVDENRLYGDMLANPVSIWYYKNEKTELEPIGPLEIIDPGGTVSFTEQWWLLEYNYPSDKIADLNEIKKMVKDLK